MGRQMLILCTCIIMAFLTYKLPFFLGASILIEEATDQIDELQMMELDELLSRKSLSEAEFARFQELAGENERRAIESLTQKNIDLFEPGVYKKFRESSIVWLVFVWVVFLYFIPKSMLEFFEAIFLPVIWYIFSGIILIEIAIILSLSFFIYLIKQKIKKNRKECSTKG